MKQTPNGPGRKGGGRFFCPTLATTDRPPLDPAQTHHLLRVLRAPAGHRFHLFDGRGVVAEVELPRPTPPVQLRVLRRWCVPQSVPRVAIAVPPPAPARFDLLAEKCTELGVAELVPLLPHRRPPDLRRRLERGASRWRRITIEAAKQSGDPWLPALTAAATPGDIAGRTAEAELVVATLEADAVPVRNLVASPPTAPDVVAVVGPEGGFTPAEIAVFRDAEARFVDLGPHVLRVETAALVLAAFLLSVARPPVAGTSGSSSGC